MRYSEETLKGWTSPASSTEEQRIANTISMIKSAIDNSKELSGLSIEIFVQGSYANNTNVKTNSDVDVCVMLTSTFFTEYPEGKTDREYGFTEGTITFEDYKRYVTNAIKAKFGSTSVVEGNKSLKISSNSYHVNADVVVAFMLKNYKIINSVDPDKYVEGIKFFDKSTKTVINYPKIHIENGKSKNNRTNHRYKYLVRIFKKIRNNMVTDGEVNGEIISSFLTECLIWNVPERIIMGYSTWTETVRQAILFLYDAISGNKCKEWGEVSEYLYLFHPGRKWNTADVQTFMAKMWWYMGYDK